MALAGAMTGGAATEMLEDWIAAGGEAAAASAGAPWVDGPGASEAASCSPVPSTSANSKVSDAGKDGPEEGVSLTWPLSGFAMFRGAIAGLDAATDGTAPATGWLTVWTSKAAAAIPKDDVGADANAAGSLWVPLSNDLCTSFSVRVAVPAREEAADAAISFAGTLEPTLAPASMRGAIAVGSAEGLDPSGSEKSTASAKP